MKNLEAVAWAAMLGIVSVAAPSAWAQTRAHVMVKPADLKWIDVPSLPAGAKLA